MTTNAVNLPAPKPHDLRLFIKEFGKFAVIQFIVLGFCLYCFFSFPRDNDPSAWGLEKRQRMETTPGPRLVIMGDSNVVLGLNSGPIAAAFPEYHPVNAGLYAFLGHRIILEEIADMVQKDDVVVLTWAYSHFAKNEIQSLYYHYAVQRPESFKHFTWEETSWFLDSGMTLIKEAMKRTRKIVLRHERDPFGKPYGRDNLNEYGDGIGHYGMPSPPGTTTTIKQLVCTPDGYTGKVIDMLNDFNARMEAKGAHVLFAYPPISEASYEENKEALQLLDKTLRTELDFPVINQQNEKFYEPEEFFDTAYHLKKDAVFDRTDRLIENLRPYLLIEPESEKVAPQNQP
ncbi:hypothetical protein [Cerasicoccus arenae]|uniref:Uncharacterized protein n=1 Tax=Cerasicoccus arenae TaxID=424488 RepID=A0A8J3GCK3_9BACT|nr:hypothetical protein [Cerasicoccus arenae]MBK1856727.1 hypothetical protein [Cerasicoccus arenae]GHB99155.1 hypothetical protein GCM10007047_14090 [Cerasicoccus arenae]